MAKSTRQSRRAADDRKIPKTFRLAPAKLAAAQSILGTATATETIATALDLPRMSTSFGNDILLALTCREHGVCLVTENVRDFERIRRVCAFEFTAAWPRSV